MGPDDPGRSSARSRAGCWTCRAKKVKCDEQRPRCRRCERLGRECDFKPRPRKKYTWTSKNRHASRGQDQDNDTDAGRDGDTQTQPPQPEILSPLKKQQTPQPSLSVDSSPPGSLPAAQCSLAPDDLDQLSPQCRDILVPTDRVALGCYHTVIAPAIDTKDPRFSVPSIVWALAQTRSVLLHLICALSSRQWSYQQDTTDPCDEFKSAAVEHYVAGMRLLAVGIHETADSSALDATLAALWLMIVYEQKFGDGCGHALRAHLRGAASVVRARLHNLKKILNWDELYDFQRHSTGVPDDEPPGSVEEWRISPFAGRMIVWISFLDGGAAFHGFGGDFNLSLGEAMQDLAEDDTLSRLRGFTSIHRYSTLMCRNVWKSAYPQQQLLEDLGNRDVFYLYGQVGQLRYSLAQLTAAYAASDDMRRRNLAQSTGRALRYVSERYFELLELAPHLDREGMSERDTRSITNVRFVVPFYHAVVLCYFRIINRNAVPNERQALALQQIILLAYQGYRDNGSEAIARMAWPLFIAALETTDLLHKDWILARIAELQARGVNYRRAYAALVAARAAEGTRSVRTDYISLLDRDDLEKFVI